MNFTLHIILCGLLLAATLGVAMYRKWLENHCDHYIHLHNDSHDSGVIQTQQSLCQRLEGIGKMQTYMVVAVVFYAVVIGGAAAYHAWSTAGNPS